jgi:hypothetical protein
LHKLAVISSQTRQFWAKIFLKSHHCSLDRCYDFKNIFAKQNRQTSPKIGKHRRKIANIAEIWLKIAENWQKSARIAENWLKKRRKLAKIAENCDQNIDPRCCLLVGNLCRRGDPSS